MGKCSSYSPVSNSQFSHPRDQAHREGGVAGASAPGPGGPKGAQRAPSKNKACVKRGESEAEMGRLKTVHQAQHNASSLFFEGPPGPLLGPLRTPGPRLQLPSGIQDLPRAAG